MALLQPVNEMVLNEACAWSEGWLQRSCRVMHRATLAGKISVLDHADPELLPGHICPESIKQRMF